MLDRITSVKDTTAGLYEWTQDAGYSVRPAGFRNNRAVALSRVISRVEISRANLIELLVDVQRLFDETYGRRPQSPKHMPARVRPSIERPVSLSMTNVSVRAILNEIMRQHGRMSWLAEYADPAGGHRGLKLSFVGFDNWTVSATARTR
jgi:hypothetical protein